MRGRSGDRGGGVFALPTLKNGKCQNEIKKYIYIFKNVQREREKWVRVRVDDRVKNEGGRGKPSLSLRGESKPPMNHYVAVSRARACI